jgi:Spy/CpxP family protein refolding chaperone
MKKHKLIEGVLGVAGLLALGTFAPGAFAQQAGSQDQDTPPAATQPGPKMHKHGEGMFADLNLTDDQKAQIKKIRDDAKSKADAVKADGSLADADKRAKLREIHRTAMMESRKVLTTEQRAQLKEKVKERRAARAQTQPS